jgi:predicted DNA binding CopG/RHH family protein
MKRVSEFKTDAEAEAFLEQDLSGLDFKQFKPIRFEVAKKEAALNMRLPTVMLDAVRAKAKANGIPYARYVRGWCWKPTCNAADKPRPSYIQYRNSTVLVLFQRLKVRQSLPPRTLSRGLNDWRALCW